MYKENYFKKEWFQKVYILVLTIFSLIDSLYRHSLYKKKKLDYMTRIMIISKDRFEITQLLSGMYFKWFNI